MNFCLVANSIDTQKDLVTDYSISNFVWQIGESNHWNVWLFCLWMCRSRRSGAFGVARCAGTSRTNARNRPAMSLCFYPEDVAKFASKKAMEVFSNSNPFISFELLFYRYLLIASYFCCSVLLDDIMLAMIMIQIMIMY